MEKKWVFLFVVAVCGLALAQDNHYEYYEDYNKPEVDAKQTYDVNKEADNDQIFNYKQNDDYDFDDTLKGWFEEKNDEEKTVDENANRSEDGSVQLDADTKVDKEIQQFQGYADEAQEAEALDVNDYQVEDNRPILEEEHNEPNENDGNQLEVAEDSYIPSSEIVIETKDLFEDTNSKIDTNEDNNDLINGGFNEIELNSFESEEVNDNDVNEDEVDSLESKELNEKDTEDIKNPIEDINRLSALVNEAMENEEDENVDNNENIENSENNSDESLAMDIEENNEFWGVINDDDNEDDKQNDNKYEFNAESNIENEPELEEDSSIENDDDNIDKELEEKINELNSIYDNVAQNSYLRVENDNIEEDNVEENSALVDEEKNGRPFREEYVLGLREQLMNDETNIHDESLNEEINGNYKNDFDDLIEPDGQDEVDENAIVVEAVPYLNDAISNENKADIVNDSDMENNDDIESDDNEIAVDHVDQLLDVLKEAHVLLSPNLDNLTNSELEDLDKQFSIDHKEDLDVNSKNFDRNVAPILMHLEVGVPVVITSPNYPEPYPTNNIIDWILEGNGIGLELNITDLSVNGFMGDYLLVKPGGIDESGHEGLLFSYQLRSVRRYRFLDVNRLFVRFEVLPGMAFSRGFSYSVKLLSHLAEPEEPMPEPEPIIHLPDETLLVFLGGVTTEEFSNITEEFRLIVADMATLYINSNGIDIGNVTIGDATHITMVQVCHIAWPGFESCAGVRFGVQLDTDVTPGLTELQLERMWRSYVDSDPFASRLRRLGVTEFAVPNDGTTLMVWLVIGLGVAISAGMLALALWRWTCYDEYTRMPAFNDTDSIISNEKKKNLDLYPTPHQTLPPLYNDEFIKYEDSTRVDMGGFANQSYTRDAELYDLESDDDIGALPGGRQHRNTNIQPKDIY